MQLWLQSWWQAFRRDIRESRGLIFGIFALVIGGLIVAVIVAESGDDRSVSSSPVRRASTTVSQPKPTVVRVQPTPTRVATATPEACPTKAELAYFKETVKYFDVTSKSALATSDLLMQASRDISVTETLDWQVTIAVHFTLLKEAADTILDATAPLSVRSISEPVEMSARLLKYGINNFLDAGANSDIDALEDGTIAFEQAASESRKAGEAATTFCE